MINLLPPVQKEQIRYAKLNQAALRYLRTLVTVLVALGAIFGASIFLLNQQADKAGKKQDCCPGPLHRLSFSVFRCLLSMVFRHILHS